ncbi:unnamed protein product [Caenorhabditis auriculariae]|uniref:Uncharacterized protein n=1 Tax=Caenorhabditis auriculariae TaxID=2777116 RepID=A0A8S1HDV9_9PELO|nr:unnamed protein product [Caenorhabditis auriculariae]
MALYKLPKTGLVLLRNVEESEFDLGPIVFGALSDVRFAVLHLAGGDAFLKDFYRENVANATFLSFDENNPVDGSCSDFETDRYIVFPDLDLYFRIFGIPVTAQLLNILMKKFCVVALCSQVTVPPDVYKKFASFADVIFLLTSFNENKLEYRSTTMTVDPKGRLVVTNEKFTLVPGGKPKVEKVKVEDEENVTDEPKFELKSLQTAFDIGLELKDTEKAAKGSLMLPYMTNRQEDGVAIRDATRRKNPRRRSDHLRAG